MNAKTAVHSSKDLSDDILNGAQAIAEFLFGADDKVRSRRKIYHLVETSRLPVFRLGSVLCARKSVLIEYIRVQETKVLAALQD